MSENPLAMEPRTLTALSSHVALHHAAMSISVFDSMGGQSFMLSTGIIFDTAKNEFVPELYTFDSVAGTIIVLTPGSYDISYQVSMDLAVGNARTTSMSNLLIGGIPESGVDSYGYHRNAANGRDTNVASITIDLSANDIISVNSEVIAGATQLGTIGGGSRLNIRKNG